MTRYREPPVVTLAAHPNLPEILGVRAQLPHIADHELRALSTAWRNTAFLAEARARALEPDSPLVVEVLAAFETAQALFAEDTAERPDAPDGQPLVAVTALKAIRDAIAGAYARPALRRGHYQALMTAWRRVFPTLRTEGPDFGPRAEEIKACLAVLPLLAARCHDARAANLYGSLQNRAYRFDRRLRETARDEAWLAACLTARRRLWTTVRRSGVEVWQRPCLTCPPQRRREVAADAMDGGAAVMELCLDAACALLVADAVDDNLTDTLVLPLRELVPEQRPAEETSADSGL
jgi:hypothetical protein